MSVSRRIFIRNGVATVGLSFVAPSFLSDIAQAQGVPNRRLVVVYLGGGNDPYKSLKTALRAEIDEDAWATLYSDVSRPFSRPNTGRIAVKVINHFGDEVLKVFGV